MVGEKGPRFFKCGEWRVASGERLSLKSLEKLEQLSDRAIDPLTD